MSWPQWSVGATSTLPGVINPAPSVTNPTQSAAPPNVLPTQYTQEQWAQLQQQNWQQWAQWQQQYQQWHQQYGAEYQKSLNALNAQGAVVQPIPPPQGVTPSYPNTSLPPPPPAEPKPPPPPEEPSHSPAKPFENIPPNNQGNYGNSSTDKFGPNYPGGRNQNWHNRNQRFGNQRTPPDHFGKRNSSQPGGVEPKRGRDENWQKVEGPPPNQWNAASQKPPPKAVNSEELSEAEKKFDKQFAEWEAQFNKWKSQNANHPDKTQYREYEKKWETWRAQLLERREQMRRKRLNLASASPNASAKASPHNEVKPPLLKNPPALDPKMPAFNRPPPTVNNDPLEFSKRPVPGFDDVKCEPLEKKEFDASFLTSAGNGSIPGLDLVKEEEGDDAQPCDADVDDRIPSGVNRTQDLEALSKGISNILGDQKLLSMLSLVSQNQNLNFNPAGNAVSQPPKNDYTSHSTDDNSNPDTNNYTFNRPPENFAAFDDQTRSSFTAGQGDHDMRFEPARPDEQGSYTNFREFDQCRPNDNFRGPSDYDNYREADGPRGPKDFRGPQGPKDFRGSRGPNDFRGPQGPNDFRGPQGPTDFRGPQGPNDFRGPQGPSDFRGGLSGPNDFRGPPRYGGGDQSDGNEFRSPSGLRDRDDHRGPNNMRGPPPGFNQLGDGGDGFNRGYEKENNFNRGPNFDRFGDKRGRDNFNTPPDRWNRDQGPEGFNRNDRFGRNSFDDQNDFGSDSRGYNNDHRTGGPGNFDTDSRENFDKFREGPNYMRNNFIENKRAAPPSNFQRNEIESFTNDYNRSGPGNFSQGLNRGAESFGRNNDNYGRNENNFSRGRDTWNEPPRNFDDYSGGSDDIGKGNNFTRGVPPKRFAGPPEDRPCNYEPPASDHFGQPEIYDEHSSHASRDTYNKPPASITEPVPDETSVAQVILKPETVIEYDHKPLKSAEPDVIIEPVQTFDYRHKPVNRIPLPQRPQWLSEVLRGAREFEPLNVRALEHTRRYTDWKYEDRKKYDGYYEERRRRDDPVYGDARSEQRYMHEERRSYERSRSREHEDFGEDSRYRSYGRHEERRKYDEDVPSGRSRYEDRPPPLHSDRVDERDKRVEEVGNQIQKPSSAPVNMTANNRVTLIEDILSAPGRFSRPPRIVIILRGPPGSGKTTLAKLIKDKEVENGGSAPRILSLDDYFMVEQEREVTEDGRKVKIKDMKYEYEECMEASYRASLMKSFKKTITDGYFNFIVVDNVNDKVKYFGEMWSFAKQNGFQVYICQLELDVQTCTKRNVHGRTEAEIEKCVSGWEPTPSHHPLVDATSLVQAQSIPEVEMEEINSPPSAEEEGDEEHAYRSKWDAFDCSLDNLAKLDGTSKPLKPSRTMEDYLQLDDWEPKAESKPGQKRVRWADLEERKEQEKMRAIGFVVGQTNWDRMMDPTMGGSALTQTKYIERVGKYYLLG